MWIKLEQLATELKKGLKPVYLLSGDEPLQLGESADLVRAACKKQGYKQRELLIVDHYFSWEYFFQASESLSIFLEKKIIDLRIPSAKVGTEGSKALINYCKNIPEDTILLVSSGKLDKSGKKSKWVTSLEQRGIALQIWPLEGSALLYWLQQRLQKKKLSVDDKGLSIMAGRVEGNLLAAAQEIEKLYVLYGANKITAQNIYDVVTDAARYDVFNLVDAALSGRVVRVINILSALQDEGIAAPVILWALVRETRQLIHIKAGLKNGKAEQPLFMKYQVWDKRQNLVKHVLNKLSANDLMSILVIAAQADRQIKGLEPGDYWQTLLLMSLMLTGKKLMNV